MISKAGCQHGATSIVWVFLAFMLAAVGRSWLSSGSQRVVFLVGGNCLEPQKGSCLAHAGQTDPRGDAWCGRV